MTNIISSNLGYPRIGEKREWKRALENFWEGKITEATLLEQTREIRLSNLKKQADFGIDLIPVGDFSLYDHVLDTAVAFGLVPKRFAYEGGKVDLKTYFQIARGAPDAVASEMTKWFNTNYHYIVPELNEVEAELVDNPALRAYREAKETLGIDGKPVLLGPISFILLSKGYAKADFPSLVDHFLPLYVEQLRQLQDAGASWVQIDEPIFVTKVDEAALLAAQKVYRTFAREVPDLKILFQTYFEKIYHYEEIIQLPVAGFGLDFVHGDSLEQIRKFGFPQGKTLAAGILDGRNVWRADLGEKLTILESLTQFVKDGDIIVQASSSLLHVPVTKRLETHIDAGVRAGISFADEKLEEIVCLTKGLREGRSSIRQEIEELERTLAEFKAEYRSNEAVRLATAKLRKEDATRQSAASVRLAKQAAQFKLPLLPTTTIGSLPQTPEVRHTRSQWRKGEISDQAYEQFVKEAIEKWIRIQEELDLDVLVHGEFERNDMVEYFGEKLEGFLVTEFGWVQSYGSRCVKPPLIFGDVAWAGPMTVKESVYAQSLTDRPVKGMLTGPVTILNWSFAHDASPYEETMNQIALALRQEIEALEKAGIHMIQVDEPALREGLPLNPDLWGDYLEAAAYAFRLATSGVHDETQIHTHMCYSQFEDIFDTIDALDADVISIESSRSHGELVSSFEANVYEKEIGLGVYDIHSPRIPRQGEIEANIRRALRTIPASQFWVNPDCGLKTRKEDETIEALQVMVKSAKAIRQELLQKA